MLDLREFSTDDARLVHYELQSAGNKPPLRLVSTPQAVFEVTILADVVDATDGLLSLREAIDLANVAPGADTITFTDAIRGGTISLVATLPTITDDLTIDGDPLDGGPAGIVIDAGGGGGYDAGFTALDVDMASLSSEDLTIQNGYSGIRAINSAITVTRSAIVESNSSIAFGIGIDAEGGTVSVVESYIGNTNAPNLAAGVRIDDTELAVTDSRLKGNSGEYGFGIIGSGDVVVTNSTIADNSGGNTGGGIDVEGSVLIEGSTLSGNGGYAGAAPSNAILVDGDLQLINSTIVNTRTTVGSYVGNDGPQGAAIGVATGSTASIVNSTISGSYGDAPSDDPRATATAGV